MKVLITSDIHINQFASHNILNDPYFRLKQFETLSQRFVEIINKYKIDAVMIAGDFLHVASPRPFIVNAAAKFLTTVSSHAPVYITHGQHDYDSRTLMTSENSLLTLYDNLSNVEYLHKQSVKIGDKKFYFQGWTPEQDFSQIKEKEYDVLIGHATVNGAIMNDYGTTANGPEFANDKFTLCFMGDIHKAQTIKNIVIPGPPIQANAGDNEDNSVIVLDTDDLSYERVSTYDTKLKFLQFLTNGSDGDPYVVIKAKKSKKSTVKESLEKSVDVIKVIDKFVTEQKLTHVHDQVSAITSKLIKDELDLNYTIENIKLSNFRSVKELDWKPPKGISLIVGKIGTGKSTLIQAIKFGLLGHRTPKSLVRFSQTDMCVELTVKYGGILYTIVRGFAKKSGFTRYYVNGTEVEFENQTEANNRIKKDLQFLTLYNAFHRTQANIYFLEEHGYAERVEMISKVIRLSITEDLMKSADFLKTPVVDELNKLTSQKLSLISYLSNFKDVVFEDETEESPEDVKKLNDAVSQLSLLAEVENRLDIKTNECDKLNFAINQYADNDFDNFNFDSKSLTDELDKKRIDLTEFTRQASNTDAKLHSESLRRHSVSLDISNFTKERVNLIEKLNQISDHVCYTCSQQIDKDMTEKLRSDINTNVSKLNDKLSDADLKMLEIVSSIKQLTEDKDVLTAKTDELAKSVSDLKIKISNIDQMASNYKKYLNLKEQLVTRLKEKNDLTIKVNLFRKTINNRFQTNINSVQDMNNCLLDFRNRVSTLTEKLNQKSKMKSLKDEYDKATKSSVEIEKSIEQLQTKVNDFDRYIVLMSSKGQVVRSVLTTVSDSMSNDLVKVVAFKTLANEETRPDFNVYLKVANNWINYDELSGGQKNTCDIFVLNHLIDLAGGAGSLILDETFSQVGFEDLEPSIDILKSMKVNHIFVVSHHESFPSYDQVIQTHFDENGVTTYTGL